MYDKPKREEGSIVVEATFILPIVLITMFMFLNIINLFILHSKIQFALNATAHELAGYSYVYQLSGVEGALDKIHKDGKKYTESLLDTAESITKVIEDGTTTVNTLVETVEKGKGVYEQIASLPGTLEDAVNSLENSFTGIYKEISTLPDDAMRVFNEAKERVDGVYLDATQIPKDLSSSIQNVLNISEEVEGINNGISNIGKELDEMKSDFAEIKDNFSLTEIKSLSTKYNLKLKDNSVTALKDELNNVYQTKKEEFTNLVEGTKGKIKQLGEDINGINEFILGEVKAKKGTLMGQKDDVEKTINGLKDTAIETKDSVIGFWEQLKELYDSVMTTFDSGKEATTNVIDRAKDWKGSLVGGGFLAFEAVIFKGKEFLAREIVKPFFKRNLGDSDEKAEAFLKSYGLEGGFSDLSFDGSSYLNDNDKKMIDLIVTYEFNLSRFKLLESISKLKVTQRVTIPAWLDGDGVKPNDAWKFQKKETKGK